MDGNTATADFGAREHFISKIEGLAASELIEASGRLIALTNSLNLEDCDKILPFLVFPFVDDFEKLRAQSLEARKIYGEYSLENPFDSCLFKKMQVLAHKLAPRANAFVAYCEMKSQLCLNECDFFFEVYTRVEDRVRSSPSLVDNVPLMYILSQIRSMYDAYLPTTNA